MNKKGFTLVEILAVIIILAVLGIITYPIIKTNLDNTKKQAYETTVHTLEEAAKKFGVTNFLDNSGKKSTITLKQLIDGGYIEEKVLVNPINNKKMGGCIFYKWIQDKKQYEYKYNEECDPLETSEVSKSSGAVLVSSEGENIVCAVGVNGTKIGEKSL